MASRNLSDAQRSQLATRYMSGATPEELKGFAGLTVAQIRAELASPRTKDIISSNQDYYNQSATRVLVQFHMASNDSAQSIIEQGKDRNNPQLAFQANKYIIDKVLPDKQIVSGEINHNIYSTEQIAVFVDIRDRLSDMTPVQSLQEKKDSFSRYILHGTEGIETAEPTPSTTIEVPGNGSGHQPENDPDGKPEPPPSD